MTPKTEDREALRAMLLPLVEELTILIAERLIGMRAAEQVPTRANSVASSKPTPRKRQAAPAQIIGGIDPTKSYPVREFLTIARISRQKFSTMRRAKNGLTVRDAAGVPFVLGKDWMEYLERAPKHIARQRWPAGGSPESPDSQQKDGDDLLSRSQ